MVLIAGFIAHTSAAQTGPQTLQVLTGGTGVEIPTGTLDGRRWLRSFWVNAFGRPISQQTGLIFEQQGSVPTQLDVFEFQSAETLDQIDADGTFQVYTWENQITIPVPPDMMAILNAGGVLDARFGVMVGRLTTMTGYDREVVGYTFEIDVPDTAGAVRSLINFFPMTEVCENEFWYNVYDGYETILIETGPESNCGNAIPGTPLGDYCFCTAQAKNDAKNRALRDGAATLAISVTIGGCPFFGPAAPFCAVVVGVVSVGYMTLSTIANVNEYFADMDACEYAYCSAVGCP